MQFSGLFRIKSSLAILVILAFSNLSIAEADTANPPKIGSVVQITSGPYKPGDVIVFDVNITGGNPAIKFVSVNGECLSSYNRWGNSKYLNWKFTDFNPNYYAVNRISATIQANCVSGLHSLTSIEVIDATDLSASAFGGAFGGISGAFKYEVINGQLIAPGSIRPEPKSDSVDLSMIPTTIEFSGSTLSIKLPRLSLGGNNLGWTGNPASDAATICRIRREFPGDNGYSLEITGPGNCNLQVGTSATHLYSATFKELSTKIIDKAAADKAAADKAAADKAAADKAAADKAAAAEAADRARAAAQDAADKAAADEAKVKAEAAKNKRTTITCIKGKLTKKVTAVKPKCPTGYKLKK